MVPTAVSWILWGISGLVMMLLAAMAGMLFGTMPWYHRFLHLVVLFFGSVGLGDLMAATYAIILYSKNRPKKR